MTPETPAEPFTIDEWFCALLARTIRDRELVFHGFGSPCAQIAMYVAKRNHAPAMTLVEGSTYAVDPDPVFIPPTSNDWSLIQGASSVLRFEDLFDLAARGEVDRMFLSGVQIDPWGNTNVTAIGDPRHPKVKIGGGGGGCNMSFTVRRTTLWTTRHRSGRTLVEDCDVVTDLGHRVGNKSRGELGATGGGPDWLVTELGVLRFDDSGRMRLHHLFPDVTLEEAADAARFDVLPVGQPTAPPLPTAPEVAVVRELDPLGVRHREFAEAELERRFMVGDDGAVQPC